MTVREQEYLRSIASELAQAVAGELRKDRDDRPLLGMGEVAERLDVSPKLVRDLVSWKGGRPPQLASIVVGKGARKVEQSALDAYLEERRQAQAEDLARGPVPRSRNGRLTHPQDDA